MKCVSAVQAFINLGKMDNIKVSLQHVSGKVNRMCNFGFIVVQLKLLAEVLFFFFLTMAGTLSLAHMLPC